MVGACCVGGVSGFGKTELGVMIVGISPGKEELKSGYPFTGTNGKLLHACLSAVDVDIHDLYYTNYMCSPNCSNAHERFVREVEDVNPRVIVTLGAPACEAILGVKLGSVRGQMIRRDNRWFLPTVQPIAALQGGGSAVGNDLIRDLRKIHRILKFVPTVMDYHVVRGIREAQQILNHLKELDGPIAIDIETSEMSEEQENAFDYQLVCIGVGVKDFAWVIPAIHCKDLEWPNVEWLGHNAYGFDRPEIKRYLGVDLPIAHDTLLQSYSLDERRNSSLKGPLHRLKPLAREYCGADVWESGKRADVYRYNAYDVMYTAQLHEVLREMQVQDGVWNLYHDLLMNASSMLGNAQIYGCKIDVDEMVRLMVRWIPKLDESLKSLQGQARELGFDGDINPASPKQVSHLLFDIMGLPGGPSTAIPVLSELYHPFITQLQDHKQLAHMLSTYVDGIRDDIKHDERIHPKVLLHGTVTGRLAYIDPPVQTIPQEHTVGSLAELRRMFVPSDEDHLIMESDYAQLDIWMAASLSNDPNMIADLTEPYWENGTPDYHSRVTENVLGGNRVHSKYPKGSPELEDWDAKRFMAKKITFGVMFMEGPPGLANKNTGIGCTINQAKRYIEDWYKRYPDFHRWQKAIVKEARTNGEVTSPFGRKRRMPLIVDSRSDRQIGNFPIQSAEADCTLTSALQLASLLEQLDSHILFLVHDSIVMDVSKYFFEEVTNLVRSVMQKSRAPGLLGVPVDIKAGPNWYDTEKVV